MISLKRKLEGIPDLYQSVKYSDLTIKCKDRTFPVHKAIVCPQSPVLAAEVEGNWLESTTCVITHDVYDAHTMARMNRYLYTGSYESPAAESNSDVLDLGEDVVEAKVEAVFKRENPEDDEEHDVHNDNRALIIEVNVFGIADFYQIPSLMRLARDNYKSFLERHFDKQGFIEILEQVCSLGSAANILLTATVECMRDHLVAIQASEPHWTELCTNPKIQSFVAFMMRDLNDRARQLPAHSTLIDLLGPSRSVGRRNTGRVKSMLNLLCQILNQRMVACTSCERVNNGQNRQQHYDAVFELREAPNGMPDWSVHCKKCGKSMHGH